jgi:hypothetical protein
MSGMSLYLTPRMETKRVLLVAANELDSVNSIGGVACQLPARLSLRVMTRLVSVFRDNVSYQDVCQLFLIKETLREADTAFETISVRVSLMMGRAATNIELEIQKHAWTACFNCFQNEVRLQLEEMGYRSHFFSFSLFPPLPVGQQGNEMASDLYLCMRIGSGGDDIDDGIFGPADVDPKEIHGNMTAIGFAL